MEDHVAVEEPLEIRVGGQPLAVTMRTPGHDARRPLPPSPLTADWTLIRFHFGARGRRGNYSETELREWADRIEALRERAEVYAYFNNDWEAFAVRNGLRLRRLLGA